jgi:signal transduction histidine kinase
MAKQKEIEFSVEDLTTVILPGDLAVENNIGTKEPRLMHYNYDRGIISSKMMTMIVIISICTLESENSPSSHQSQSPSAGAYLLIDAGKIDQVLQNLLTNAVSLPSLL